MNNRSLLAIAGEQSLFASQSNETFLNKFSSPSKMHNTVRPEGVPSDLVLKDNLSTSKVFDPKQIIKKLGLARLRKMQALVRGFIVRRTIYPR